MQQIIQLNSQDDMAAIRARIEAAELSHIVFVVPRDCWVLQSESGLRLLRRAAEDLGAQIALVAHDDVVRDLAEEFGFPVFNSIAQAQRSRWRMQPLLREAALRPKLPSPRVQAAPHVLAPAVIKHWRVPLALLGGAMLVLCFAAFLLVPTAQVRIVPASVALTMTTDVAIDTSIPQVNAETRAIPARRLFREISGTAQLRTTTTKNIPDARATGTVIFTNLRSQETEIPQGTVVKTSAGVPIRFTTTTTGTLPAGVNSRVDVPIQAVDPGPAGNVKELAINTIDGALSLEARVINLKSPMSGNLRSVKVVTAEDKRKLDAQLLQQLQQQAPQELRKELKPDEFLPPDSVLVEVEPNDKVFDHVVDDPADVLNLKMTATAFGLGVNQDDLQTLVSTMLQKQMQPGYQLLPNGVKVDEFLGGKYQGIQLRQTIRAVGYTTPQVDRSKVARALQAKSVDEAEAYLSNAIDLAQPPEIGVFPFGWRRMPWFSFRIAVFVEPQMVLQ